MNAVGIDVSKGKSTVAVLRPVRRNRCFSVRRIAQSKGTFEARHTP